MDLDAEEQEVLLTFRRRRGIEKKEVAPVGIGTGNLWAKAKLEKKRFIDEATYIDKEGNTEDNKIK